MSTLKVNNLKNVDGTRTLASDSGTAWGWGSGVPKGSVIEEFMSPCDGSAITVQSGTYTIQAASGVFNLNSSWDDVTGSTIDYVPPTGTQTVVYSFTFQFSFADPSNAQDIGHFKLFLDNDSGTATEVTDFRTTIGAASYLGGQFTLNWAFHIGGSTTTATGRVATWTSARTIKIQAREYGSSSQAKLFQTQYWDGTTSDVFSRPVIGIKALA